MMSGIQAPPGFRDMRLVLLQHGGLASLTGKTGLAMLRHRAGPIVAVIDPDHAGQSLQRVTGIERDVPVVADLSAALPYDCLLYTSPSPRDLSTSRMPSSA